MFYVTNREVGIGNGEREIFEYPTSRHQLENITIPKLQSVECIVESGPMSTQQLSHSHIKLSNTCVYYKEVPQGGNIDARLGEVSEEYTVSNDVWPDPHRGE